MANIDGQQRDYKAAIDELRDKQEQVMTLLNEIKASSPNTRLGGGSSKAYINREVSVNLDLFHVGVVGIFFSLSKFVAVTITYRHAKQH